ncbi:hypothetical protein M378DRAFT_70738 [Amanita muscaria Koide BX008]|uniref:Chromatin associated protein KTI12 n=1 Tax=Amanita muscaria (strain Koide BX008) TaxID=946122 RepID=A0A0C2SZL8_AMAMK|nr:hypothetical protein M378DRAFT_70738 [Amanita muscaria Koide BX008]
MALITVTGLPCSGKSTRINQLRTFFGDKINRISYEGPLRKVFVLSDDDLEISRSVYDDSQTEKSARASLFSATQRALAADTILILDGMNYIKGFRYQLHCAVREARLRSCTLYVAASPDLCRDWNDKRSSNSSYSPETLKNLIQRFEEPSSMVRWDSPLFTVMWSDDSLPLEEIWDAITKGNVKPPNAATVPVSKTPTNALHALESTTTNIISAIMQHLSGTPVADGTLKLAVTANLEVPIRLPQRSITIAELQRAKRQFVMLHKKAVTLGSTDKGEMDWSEDRIATKFVRYLEEYVSHTK